MKYIYLFITILLLSACSTIGDSINKTQYMNADKIIYEKFFGERIIITDQPRIEQLKNIISSAKAEATDFVPRGQIIFITNRDTVSIHVAGSMLRDDRGTYRLGTYMTQELNKYLEGNAN